MRKTAIVLIIIASVVFAQEKEKKGNWNNEMIIGFGLSQLAYSNWSQGGDSQLSWTLNFAGKSVYETDAIKWTTAMKIAYGQNKVGDGINKITQNDLLFNSLFSLKSDWVLDYYGGVNLITQIAPGFNYDEPKEVQINSFFDPADLTESVGLLYAHGDVFKSQLGVGLHQVFANSFYDKTDDPETSEIETTTFETGIESITTFNWTFAENVTWASYLRLFSAFDRLDTWDVRWDNTLVGKVNSWLNVTLSWIVVYDVKETLRTQAKQGLQIGVSYKLL